MVVAFDAAVARARREARPLTALDDLVAALAVELFKDDLLAGPSDCRERAVLGR